MYCTIWYDARSIWVNIYYEMLLKFSWTYHIAEAAVLLVHIVVGFCRLSVLTTEIK